MADLDQRDVEAVDKALAQVLILELGLMPEENDLAKLRNAAIAALDKSREERGLVCVPKEPTQEAVRSAYAEQPGSINVGFAQAYRTMIAAHLAGEKP